MAMDLTEGKPDRVLWSYSLPLFGSIVFQQLYNIADSFVAGKFVGEQALAAVGNSYEVTLIYLSFAVGLNIGASVVTARLFGARRIGQMKTAVNTAFLLCLAVCAVLMIVGFLFSPALIHSIQTPMEIYDDTMLYLNIYTGGLVFLFFYNIATGIFASLGDSRTPFLFLAASSIANIALDVLFVTAFNMGVAGVAWATFLCQGVSCVLAVLALFRTLSRMEAEERPRLFSRRILVNLVKIALPSTLQQCFVSVGNIMIQSIINYAVALKVATDGVLRGAGRMGEFMTDTFIDLALRVVLSFVLSAPLGLQGVWWSWPVSWVVATIAAIVFYRQNRWAKLEPGDA